MKLFSIIVLYKADLKQDILKKAFDLTSFNRFQRSTVQEFLCFAAKTLTERTQIGERQSVKEAEYRQSYILCIPKYSIQTTKLWHTK